MYKTPCKYALFGASDNWKILASLFCILKQPIRIQNPRNWEESDQGTLDIDPPGSHLGHQPLGEDHGSFHFAVHNRLDWDVGKRQHNVERHKHIDDHSHFGPCIDGIVGRTSVIRSIFSHSITGHRITIPFVYQFTPSQSFFVPRRKAIRNMEFE